MNDFAADIDKNAAPRTISDLLIDVQTALKHDTIAFSALLEAFHERGFGFFLLLFAFPMALPLPVPPGINIILASPLLILTLQQMIGRHTIWMPRGIRQKSIAKHKLDKMINGALPWAKRLEMLVKPRLAFITEGIFSNIIGFLGFIMALSVCVPLPLTNTVPSFGIALMAVGVLMRDGLAVIIGAIIGSLWVAMLAGAVVFLGTEGIDVVKDFIKSLL